MLGEDGVEEAAFHISFILGGELGKTYLRTSVVGTSYVEFGNRLGLASIAGL